MDSRNDGCGFWRSFMSVPGIIAGVPQSNDVELLHYNIKWGWFTDVVNV